MSDQTADILASVQATQDIARSVIIMPHSRWQATIDALAQAEARVRVLTEVADAAAALCAWRPDPERGESILDNQHRWRRLEDALAALDGQPGGA